MIQSFQRYLAAALLISFAGFSAYSAEKHDVDLTILDPKISPCEDFYQYACGGWLAKTEIPADRPMWNRSFSTIDQNNRLILDKILKSYASGKIEPANPYGKLLGDFYGACMDDQAIETKALPEFKKQLHEIDQLTDVKSLAPLLAQLHREHVGAFFNFGQEQDAKDSTQVIGGADQGGLGLPDRDYYLKDDAKTVRIRDLYREHVQKMLTMVDPKADAKTDASTIMRIETALAQASMPRVERRDPSNVYHRLERKGLVERAPLFDWATYLNTLDPATTAQLQTINVAVPDFFVGFNQLLKSASLADLKTYLKWHFLNSTTEALPKRFQNEHFHFVSTALSGQKEIEPRWKRCVRAADSELGFALGRAFVDVAYGQEGKAKSQDMIHEIEAQMHAVLDSLSWMDKKTKEQAELKLSKISNKIGYPTVWRSYDGLAADRGSFLKSMQAAAAFDSEYELNKIGKPLDRNDWDMTPATVNAYYDPQLNEMVFPAGILQYPFFNRESPDALNYGAIGLVMGHELTHGFDDEGRQYDSNGNLRNWWDQKVLEDFNRRTSCVEKEYSAFEALPGLHVNGKLTLGENIADQGGMKLAYSAWKAKHGAEQASAALPTATAPNDEQKVFIAFAQSWCQKEQEPYTRMRITVDPHSPSRYRVNGVISQFEPFAHAFGCTAGTKMAPAQHCEVW
jgi:putative endopeptidase